jgi:GNAT superfamily N-acetyltransferase
MTLNLRPATSDDLIAVQEIVQAAYTHYVARIGREPGPLADDYATLICEKRIYVAERDGLVQGIVVLIPQDDAMLLDNVAVAPEAQGSGLGRFLLAFAEREALEAGYGAIKLYTNEAMTENIALYARIGYKETHQAEEKGLRRVYMRKPLS